MTLLFVIFLSSCSPAAPTPTVAPTQAPVSPTETEAAPTQVPSATSISMEPATIKIGIFPFSAYTPLKIADKQGYFAEQNLTVEFVSFSKLYEAITALSQGQIDVTAGVMDISVLSAIAQGVQLKYVADEGYIDPNATCAYSSWVVKPDVLGDDFTKLKGMKVIYTKAGLLEYAFDLLLQKGGLTKNDITVMDVPIQNRTEAVISGQADIAQVGEPWVTRALDTGKVVSWMPWNSYMPNHQFGAVYFGPNIYNNKTDIGKRFMVAYLKSIREFNKGKTDSNVAAMAELTKLDPAEVTKTCWQSFRNDGSIDLPSVLSFQKWAVDSGYMDKVLTGTDIWDPQFVDYANQVLGK